MVVAKNKGLITSDTCRWDEGLNRGEAINFLVTIYSNLPSVTNAERGSATAEAISAVDNVNDEAKWNEIMNDWSSLDLDGQVTYNESTDTYSYTDEWYGNFMSMTNEELNGLTKNFVNAVIQGVLEDRSGDKGENVVASWEAYKGLFEEAGIWESMKAEAVANNESDTAPAVNPVQPSNSNTNSNNSSSSSSSSKDNASTNSGDNFDNQGYMTPEEQKAAMRDLAEEWGASSDWNVQFGEDNDTNTWTDSGATYIDEDGRIHFD